MTYEQVRPAGNRKLGNDALSINMTLPDVQKRRHFVGMWAPEALVHVGTRDISYKVCPSQVRAGELYTASVSNLSIGFSKWGSISFGFSFQRKDLRLKFTEKQVYKRQVAKAGEMTVVFYSSSDKRAWMVDGASALVHLARAWLDSPSAKCKRSDVLPELQYIVGNGGCDAAIQVLIGRNRKIVIFNDSDEDENDPRTESSFTYEDLIVELFGKLEGLQEKLQDAKRGPFEFPIPSNHHPFKPGPNITGWDVEALFSGNFEARHHVLNSASKGWVGYVENISSIVLMAHEFDDLITSPGSLTSGTGMEYLPKNQDMLAVPARVLESTAKQSSSYGNIPRTCIRISKSYFVYKFDGLTSKCKCSEHSPCRFVSEIRDTYKKVSSKLLAPDAGNGSAATSFLGGGPDAALIIGKRSDFCKK